MSSSRGCQSALMFCEASVEMKPKVMSWAADRPMVRATARAALSGLNIREIQKAGGRRDGAGQAARAIAGANCGSGVIGDGGDGGNGDDRGAGTAAGAASARISSAC